MRYHAGAWERESLKTPSSVIPAKAGIQLYQVVPALLDFSFH